MAAEDKKKQAEADAKKTDAAPAEGEQPAEEGKKKKSLLPIIIIAVLVVGAAAGAGFYFLSGKPAEEGHASAEEEEKKVEEAVPHAFYDLPEMIINLSSPADESRFLKLKVTLELTSEEEKKKIETVIPRVVDDFQVYLRELRAEDLQGSVGTYRLKQSLLMRANQAAYPVEVSNVLVREMLVQ